MWNHMPLNGDKTWPGINITTRQYSDSTFWNSFSLCIDLFNAPRAPLHNKPVVLLQLKAWPQILFQSQIRFVQAEIVHGQKYFTLLISGLIWSQPSSGNSSILSIFIIAKQRSMRSTRSMSLWQEYVIKGLFKGHCFVLFCLKKKIRFPRC